MNWFESREWYKKEVELSKMGVWPEMQGLNVRLTTGNVIDTAELIRRVRSGDIIRGVCSVPQALGEKIDSMRELTDFLIEHFPLIVYQGNPVRSDYNANWSKGIRCDFFDYDIDDGSTRAVSYALEGIERVPVFLGMER